MENQIKKCSLKSHNKFNAIINCKECKLYMCEKCLVHHSELFEDHKVINLNININ